jgi:hypothetical protein
MKTSLISIIFLCGVLLTSATTFATKNNEVHTTHATPEFRHTISFCPMVPFAGIYALHYYYRATPRSEWVAGLTYMNIRFEGSGYTSSPGLILGYRRYLWKGFHLEYEIWPAFDAYYETNENRHYKGFDLWNEFRLGYKVEFQAGRLPMQVNLQWPFGFGLYASNKPDSFYEVTKNDQFFYFPPLLSFGVSF